MHDGAGFTSCREDVKDIFKGEEEETEEVPNDFDFSTWTSATVSLAYDVPQGYHVAFEVYTEYPLDEYNLKRTDILPVVSGYTDENGKFSIPVPIAASVTDLYAYSYTYGVPMLMHAGINNSVAGNFEKMVLTRSSRAAGVNKSDYFKNWSTFNVKLADNQCADIEGITLDAKTLKAIDLSLPSEKGAEVANAYFVPHITLQEEAEVKIYYVGHGEGNKRTNALAYFTYEGSKIGTRADINKNLNLIYSSLSETAPEQGTGKQLMYNGSSKIFPENTTLSFALLINAGGTTVDTDNNINVLYSEFGDNRSTSKYNFNSYTLTDGGDGEQTTANRPHMWGFSLPDRGDGVIRVVLGFEDQPFNESPKSKHPADCRDDVFILEINPPSAVSDDDVKPGVDPDEEEPDYTDTSIHSCGILAFEDLWPDKGDYDLNDVVVSYVRTYNLNQMDVVSMDETYVYMHNGALTKTNAFGYQMVAGVKRNDIRTVKVTSDYSFSGQGLDPDLEDATIMLFDSDKKCPVGTEFQVHTVFDRKLSMYDFIPILEGKPANPFIVINASNCLEENRTEVHLPTFAPTKKCNTELLGTGDDKSDLEKGTYYVRSGNYPFAIDIAGTLNYSSASGALPDFIVPAEGKSIDQTYPKFIDWVTSGGKQYTDWYKFAVE